MPWKPDASIQGSNLVDVVFRHLKAGSQQAFLILFAICILTLTEVVFPYTF